ncbi:MAG: sel1 repeat family protein [Polyangiaceae bacterium]|nr:sel1 repeat family protein [Polyangiaceae bacterium]
MKVTSRVAWFVAGVAVIAGGCGPGAVGEAVRPADPTAKEALGEPAADSPAQCRAVSRAEPLIVDWKSTERLDLELAMKEGVAVVSYDCKALKLLKGCKVAGTYGFAGVTRKEDVVQITSSDELAANLPFSAGTLGGGVSRGSSIDLALVMVGKKGTTVAAAAKPELAGSCDGATHFVRSAFVGAFAMATGTSGKARAVADMFGASAQAASASEKKTANKDGDLEACRKATADAPNPPDQCQSAVRLELVPLVADLEAKVKQADKGDDAAKTSCPEGMVRAGAKCTADAPAVTHECDHKNTAECVEQCGKGDAPSCLVVGYRHLEGKDVARDPAKAMELFKKACDGGAAYGCYQAGDQYMRARLAKDATEDQKTEARIKAEEMYNKGCQAGNGWICWNVSDWYLRDGSLAVFPKDPARAMSLVRRGCDLGYGPSCSTLARHMIEGKHTTKDVPAALALLQRACDGGRWEDCETIGNIYRDGQGLTKNPVLAIASYSRACDLGGARACNSAGVLYAKGDGLPKDPAKARELYTRGCHDKMIGWDACKSLGEAFEKGLGGPKDMAKAAEIYELGCMNGACLRAGQIWEKGEGVKADPDRAIAAYGKGCKQTSDTTICMAQGKLLEKKDKDQAKAFYTDHCMRMKEKETCDAAKRLGATGLPEPFKKPPKKR